MKSKILLLMACFSLIVPASFAAETSTEPVKLTKYETALEMMLKNNRDIQLAELNIKLAETKKAEVLKDKARYKGYLDKRQEDDKLLSYANKVILDPVTAEVTLKQNKRTLELLKTEKQRTLRRYFNDYANMNAKVNTLKNQILNKTKELSNENLKYDKGLSTKNAVSLVEISLATLKENLDTYSNELATLELQIEDMLSVDDAIIQVPASEKALYSPLEELDLKKIYASLLTKDDDLLKLSEAVETAAATYEVANTYPVDGTDLTGSKSDLEKAQKNYENGKMTLKVKISSDYLTLKKKYQTIDLKELSLKSAEISLKNTEAYLKAGKTTEIAYLTELESYNMLKVELETAITEYNDAYDEFTLFITQK